jgi:hypothetical protein
MKMAIFWIAVSIMRTMMEAAGTSETLIYFYQTARCNDPENRNFNANIRPCFE